MESTHDLDFLLWCLEPARPVRVYSQVNYGVMRETSGADIPDAQWITVTLDSGMSFVVGGGWSLPPGYPNFSTTWIEMVGTEGAILLDDSHKDLVLNTMKVGMQLPLSTMPGEYVDHTYAGAMAPETVHFLEACAFDRPVLVTPEHARMVMEVYIAADLSAERNQPVDLPLRPSKGKSLEKAA
jgi:predicted dehydrogenase